ncbi:MAG: type II secretion system protein [Nitrospirota bacterium]
MPQTVFKDKKGLTLVEVLISLLVTLILFLALMQSVLLSVNMNNRNQLRDEAVNVAEERMRELRSLDFDNADLADTGGAAVADGTVTRNFRNFTTPFTFNRTRAIDNLGAGVMTIAVTVSYMNIRDNTCSGTTNECTTDGDCSSGQTCGSTHTINSILRDSD